MIDWDDIFTMGDAGVKNLHELPSLNIDFTFADNCLSYKESLSRVVRMAIFFNCLDLSSWLWKDSVTDKSFLEYKANVVSVYMTITGASQDLIDSVAFLIKHGNTTDFHNWGKGGWRRLTEKLDNARCTMSDLLDYQECIRLGDVPYSRIEVVNRYLSHG